VTEISCKVIADSVYQTRITTVQLRYPRFIHAELMTHRVFSRNASSSRAVPVKKMIEEAMTDPVVPLFWTKNQSGMQGGESWNEPVTMDFRYKGGPVTNFYREDAWLRARDKAAEIASAFAAAGYHKQLVNRLLEPFTHISVVVTATEWANWFNLRFHEDAEPHIDLLAQRMWEAMSASEPVFRAVHAPYVDTDGLIPDWNNFDTQMTFRKSAARCARVSYLNHDGNDPTLDEDMKLFERLMASNVKHASPVEHQAIADKNFSKNQLISRPLAWGNFRGWNQWRQTFNGESYHGGIDAIATEIERRKEQRGLGGGGASPQG
jgi:Thymidylate synthase complementing protein